MDAALEMRTETEKGSSRACSPAFRYSTCAHCGGLMVGEFCMLGCLEDLASSMAARGLAFQWRRGEPVEEMVNAAREWKADVVYWNRDYEPGAIERDHDDN